MQSFHPPSIARSREVYALNPSRFPSSLDHSRPAGGNSAAGSYGCDYSISSVGHNRNASLGSAAAHHGGGSRRDSVGSSPSSRESTAVEHRLLLLYAGQLISASKTYALVRSPRTDGREAILITASWKSHWNGHHHPDRDITEKVVARLPETGLAHDPLEKEGAAGMYELLKRKRVNTIPRDGEAEPELAKVLESMMGKLLIKDIPDQPLKELRDKGLPGTRNFAKLRENWVPGVVTPYSVQISTFWKFHSALRSNFSGAAPYSVKIW
ncbi:hypothetical protein V8E36_006059 [Tilletia maclaganii]